MEMPNSYVPDDAEIPYLHSMPHRVEGFCQCDCEKCHLRLSGGCICEECDCDDPADGRHFAASDEPRRRLEPVDGWIGGGAAPYQAEGVLSDGRRFYFRARHNGIRLEVGDKAVGFRLEFPRGDDHVWSYIDEDDAANLIAFLAHTLGRIEDWERRAPTIPNLRPNERKLEWNR